jgi:hypothetical protein
MILSAEFKHYALSSVKIDRFFNVLNIYGSHHHGIRDVGRAILQGPEMPELGTLPERVSRPLVLARMVMRDLAITGLLADEEADLGPETVGEDMVNYAFFTCYVFQWLLFEHFIRSTVKSLAGAHRLPFTLAKHAPASNILRQIRKHDSAVFDLILPASQFAVLNYGLPPIEKYGLDDVDRIRTLRNELTHTTHAPSLAGLDTMSKQRRYETDMWILRHAAQGVAHWADGLP